MLDRRSDGPRSGTDARQSRVAVSQDWDDRIDGSRASSLDPATRRELEHRFDYRFGDVKIHTGDAAASLTSELGARAFTLGRDIFFSRGAYQPGTDAGRSLLAHEVAHVIQQRRGGQPPLLDPSASHERAARRAASEFVKGHSTIPVAGATGVGVARDDDKEPKSPVHGVAGGGKAPVPVPGETPFNFIAESPAYHNFKKAAKGVLGREFKKEFASFKDAVEHYKRHLKTLPSGGVKSKGTRENFARRMFDRTRKAFYRAEALKPSFRYTHHEVKLLKGGAAPRPGFQLDHLRNLTSHPEDAFDPINVNYTKGGPKGTLPKGTPHAEKTKKMPPRKKPAKKKPKGRAQKPGKATSKSRVGTRHAKNLDFATRGRPFHAGKVRKKPPPPPTVGRAPRFKPRGAGLAELVPAAMNALQDRVIRHAVATKMLAKWPDVETMRKKHPTHMIIAVVALQEWERPDPAGNVARAVNFVDFFHGPTVADAEVKASRVLKAGVPKGWREVGPFVGIIKPSDDLSDMKDAVEAQECFVATACFGSPMAPNIDVLRRFRDSVLEPSVAGRRFVDWYYEHSPPVARRLCGAPVLRFVVRECLLRPVVWLLRVSRHRWDRAENALGRGPW